MLTSPRRKGRLGILVTEKSRTPPFTEQQYYRNLCAFGDKCGLTVFVFSPGRIDWDTGIVTGYTYDRHGKRWNKGQFPLPDLIYDRCFFNNRKAYITYHSHIHQLQRNKRITFLGHGLKGKWQVNELLSKDQEIAPYLPHTEKVLGIATIKRWLTDYGELFLKPQGGSQGRNVVYIRKLTNSPYHYYVRGRDPANQLFQYGFFNSLDLYRWIKRFMGSRHFVVQRYLQLTTENGEPFDIRSFVQKNYRGDWKFIGCALRKGKPESLTSNLHGGGFAEQVGPFLDQHYGDKTARMLQDIETISIQIARTLEYQHGRLVELGIDMGIDREGQLWVLEANSKPGRTIFSHIGDKSARRTAVRNPIYYARYLWDRQFRRVT
jgi:glutathione synthase/RimK-type ligase-like ATP-grasp enzyme